MPKQITNNPEDLLKSISMYDVEEDSKFKDNRKSLDLLFHRLIMNDDPTAKEFIKKFIDSVSDIIYDMGIIDKKQQQSDEIEGEEEPEGEEGEEVVFPDEEEGEETTEEEPEAEEGEEGEETSEEEPNANDIPDDILTAGYNPLIDVANSFLM